MTFSRSEQTNLRFVIGYSFRNKIYFIVTIFETEVCPRGRHSEASSSDERFSCVRIKTKVSIARACVENRSHFVLVAHVFIVRVANRALSQ